MMNIKYNEYYLIWKFTYFKILPSRIKMRNNLEKHAWEIY